MRTETDDKVHRFGLTRKHDEVAHDAFVHATPFPVPVTLVYDVQDRRAAERLAFELSGVLDRAVRTCQKLQQVFADGL